MLALRIAKLEVWTRTARRRIGAHFILAMSGLRWNQPNIPLLSEFRFCGDLKCFDFAVGELSCVRHGLGSIYLVRYIVNSNMLDRVLSWAYILVGMARVPI